MVRHLLTVYTVIPSNATFIIASKHILPAVMRYARSLAETANQIQAAGADAVVIHHQNMKHCSFTSIILITV